MAVVLIPAEQALTPAVAAWLAGHFTPAEAFHLQLWLPTRRAGGAMARALESHGWPLMPVMRTFSPDEADAAQLGIHGHPSPPLTDSDALVLLYGLLAPQYPDAPPAQLVRKAQQLAGLDGQLLRYRLAWPQVAAAVPEFLADKWKLYAGTAVATGLRYRQTLAAAGLRSPAMAQHDWLEQLAAQWRHGLQHPVVLAGLTDATPAVEDLMRHVAADPLGTVLIPSTQLGLALARRISAIFADDAPSPPANPPADTMLVEASSPWDEAVAVARIAATRLRTGTVAVVTPNRATGRLVQAALKAHGMAAADSAGDALCDTPAGNLLHALASSMAAPDAVAMANVCSHPLVTPFDGWAAAAAALEICLWRGPRLPAAHWPAWRALWQRRRRHVDGFIRANHAKAEAAWTFLDTLMHDLTGKAPRGGMPLAGWATRLGNALHRLAPGWANTHGGAEVQQLLDSWLASPVAATVDAATCAALVQHALASGMVHVAATTPGLFLWGPLELRMQMVDTLIFAGCNDDSWPTRSQHPLLSDIQLDLLGLPNHRHRAMVAHEDWHLALAAAGCVVFSRSTSQHDGTPTVISPLLRQTLVRGDAAVWRQRGNVWLAPAPCAATPHSPVAAAWRPSGSLWPATWSASMVEALRRCPYRALAERVLGLTKLPPFDDMADRRVFGLLVHRWLQGLFVQLPGWPAIPTTAAAGDAAALEAYLLATAERVVDGDDAVLARLWQTRVPALAAMLAGHFARMHAEGWRVHEVEVSLPEATLNGVTLRAKADRLDGHDDTVRVIDYKTGSAPSATDMCTGRKPQLPMEGWLLSRHGATVAPAEVWRVHGYGTPPADIHTLDDDDWQQAVAAAGEGLAVMTVRFAEGQDFPAWPDLAEGGVQRSGHCKTCALAGVCRFREWAA